MRGPPGGSLKPEFRTRAFLGWIQAIHSLHCQLEKKIVDGKSHAPSSLYVALTVSGHTIAFEVLVVEDIIAHRMARAGMVQQCDK